MQLEAFIKHLEEQMAEIDAGRPVTVQITDRDRFEHKTVKAIIAKSADELPDGEDLWIKNRREELEPVPWKIKIIEETDDLFLRAPEGLPL